MFFIYFGALICYFLIDNVLGMLANLPIFLSSFFRSVKSLRNLAAHGSSSLVLCPEPTTDLFCFPVSFS
jgi:hypothetical protein